MYLSPRAQKAMEQGATHDRMHRAQRERMQAGPHLNDDGHTLIVPSDWYNAEAAEFWKSHGFCWQPRDREWIRDTRKAHQSKTYTTRAWLESTRREFYNYWPNLLPDKKDCPVCAATFHPIDEYQIYCPSCEATVQAEQRFHDKNQ